MHKQSLKKCRSILHYKILSTNHTNDRPTLIPPLKLYFRGILSKKKRLMIQNVTLSQSMIYIFLEFQLQKKKLMGGKTCTSMRHKYMEIMSLY